MFKSLFSKKKSVPVRSLDCAQDLQVGDIIKFKPRSILPPSVQNEQFEVTGIGCYQYSGELNKELQLRSEDNKTIYLSVEEGDGSPMLAISYKISRSMVLSLFDEDQFAELWQEDFPTLAVQTAPAELDGWLSNNYQQVTKEAEAYYYNRDCNRESASLFQDDDSEELRYHECSAENDSYGLSVEVWEDGTTDVALVVYTPLEVIAEFWPKA